jgi:hypothetical protein
VLLRLGSRIFLHISSNKRRLVELPAPGKFLAWQARISFTRARVREPSAVTYFSKYDGAAATLKEVWIAEEDQPVPPLKPDDSHDAKNSSE